MWSWKALSPIVESKKDPNYTLNKQKRLDDIQNREIADRQTPMDYANKLIDQQSKFKPTDLYQQNIADSQALRKKRLDALRLGLFATMASGKYGTGKVV